MDKFSLVYLTYRPGGIDLLGESLKHQPKSIYELIVIDDFPGRVERGEAKRYLLDKDIPLRFYGKSKEHSYPSLKVHGLANAMNSGALQASTEYIVFIHDFVWFGLGSIISWGYHTNCKKYLISGIASMTNSNPPTQKGDISIWEDTLYNNVKETTGMWIPEYFENFYCGVPLKFLEDINGINELTDCGHISWPYHSMIEQAETLGYGLGVDQRLCVKMLNHREWGDGNGDNSLWHAEKIIKKRPMIEKLNFSAIGSNPFDFKSCRNSNLQKGGSRSTPESPSTKTKIVQNLYQHSIPKCEAVEIYCIHNHIHQNDIIIDVGANTGIYTMFCANLTGPKGEVLAIEPEQDARYELFQERTRNNFNNILICPFAVADVVGERSFYRGSHCDNGSPGGDHRLWKDEAEKRESIKVQVSTIDILSKNYDFVNFIKIDTQGAEVEVLKGAEKTIARSPNIALLVEYWEYGLYKMGNNPKKLLQLLADYGLITYIIDSRTKCLFLVDPDIGITFNIDLDISKKLETSPVANLWCVKKCRDLNLKETEGVING